MAQVARAAGLAKGTPFLYFATKESLFLEVLFAELRAWAAELGQRLGVRRLSVATIAATMSASIVERERLLDLLLVLHPLLERNIDVPTALRFKRELLRILTGLTQALSVAASGLDPKRALRVLLHGEAAILGLGQMARPNEAIASALASDPALSVFVIDLRAELTAVFAALLEAARRGKGGRGGVSGRR